jgi:membrane-bound lytic murein transglycosylase B
MTRTISVKIVIVGLIILTTTISCSNKLTRKESSQFSQLPVNNESSFINYMIKKHHMKRDKISTIIHSIKYRHTSISHVNHPAESKTWKQYKTLFVTPKRIQQGADFYVKHEAALKQAKSKFHVSPYIITAIMGVETNYGQHVGNYRILDTLGTLAFQHKNRRHFFQRQLEEFILLAENKHVFNIFATKGSYAGAIGIPQFMPTSYTSYGIRFNEDNKPCDLFNDDDAIISIANYLHKHGWKKNEFIEKPLSEKEALTIKQKKTKNKIIKLSTDAKEQDYRLVSKNFKAIMSYNPRYNYAMAVTSLSKQIAIQVKVLKHASS